MTTKDIFDKIMCLPVLNKFQPLYKKNKEILLYLFFGGLTFLISIFSYTYFENVLEMNELLANIISWIIAVMFAFATNRRYVFTVSLNKKENYLKQMAAFYSGRLFTLFVEEIILAVFVTWKGFNSIVIKIIAQIIVIILNYIISKVFIFKKEI